MLRTRISLCPKGSRPLRPSPTCTSTSCPAALRTGRRSLGASWLTSTSPSRSHSPWTCSTRTATEESDDVDGQPYVGNGNQPHEKGLHMPKVVCKSCGKQPDDRGTNLSDQQAQVIKARGGPASRNCKHCNAIRAMKI